MAVTTITQKGQVVIPAKIRKKYHLKVGQKFSVKEEKEKIVLVPLKTLPLEKAKGWLGTKKSVRELLKEARGKDLKREKNLEFLLKREDK